jgi:hypothetical protein
MSTEVHIDLAALAGRLRAEREESERRVAGALARLRARAEDDQDIADLLVLIGAP